MNYIFDFDGTIIDSLVAYIAVFNKNLRDADNPLSPEEIEELRGVSSRRALKKADVRWWQLPKLFVEGMADLHALMPGLKIFKDMPETIKTLHDRGDKLFIVTTRTNTEQSVRAILKREKIEDCFIAIDAGAGPFTKSKHIRKIINAYKLKRRQTVYVGDETRDIQAARLAGLKIVSVAWGFNTRKILKKWRPNFLIDKPSELLDIKL